MSCGDPIPTHQPQNPALSGDPNGWVDCTAFSAAMAASFASCVKKKTTGRFVRDHSDEPDPDFAHDKPGLTLSQVDAVLNQHFAIDLDVRLNYRWEDFARRIDDGQGAILQVWSGSFRHLKSCKPCNHAVFVPPGWGAMDPAADGRFPWVHRYDGDPYPRDILRNAAGDLAMAFGPGGVVTRRLGRGRVYAAFTPRRVPTLTMSGDIDPDTTGYEAIIPDISGPRRRQYAAFKVANGRVVERRIKETAGIQVPCTAPRAYHWNGGLVSLVRLLRGAHAGELVRSKWVRELP